MSAKKTNNSKKPQVQEAPTQNDYLDETDRQFLQLEIADIKKKIERLENFKIDDENKELEFQNLELIEGRNDNLAQDAREYNALENEYKKLLKEYETLLYDRQTFAQNHIAALRAKDIEQRQMVEDLTAEIRHLTSELIILESFVEKLDEMVERFKEAEKNYNDKEVEHKEQLRKMDEDLEHFRSLTKQDVDRQLSKIGVEFAANVEKSRPPHVLRLLRENVAINREMNQIHIGNQERKHNIEETYNDKIEKELIGENEELVHLCCHQIDFIKEMVEDHDKTNEEMIKLQSYPHELEIINKKIQNADSELYDLYSHLQRAKQELHYLMDLDRNLEIKENHENQRNQKLHEIKQKIYYHFRVMDKTTGPKTWPCDFDEELFQESISQTINDDILELLQELNGVLKSHSRTSFQSVTEMVNYPDLHLPPQMYDKICLDYQSVSGGDSMRTGRSIESEKNIITPISQERIERKRIDIQTLFDQESDDEPLIFSDSDDEQSAPEEEEVEEVGDVDYSSDD